MKIMCCICGATTERIPTVIEEQQTESVNVRETPMIDLRIEFFSAFYAILASGEN